MRTLYRRWMEDWENRLCFRTNNRVVRPFEWGLDWARHWPLTGTFLKNGHDPEAWLRVLNSHAITKSDEFFGYDPPSDFQLDGDMLRFTSAARTPFAENNIVHAQWHPAPNHKGRAVVVLEPILASVPYQRRGRTVERYGQDRAVVG